MVGRIKNSSEDGDLGKNEAVLGVDYSTNDDRFAAGDSELTRNEIDTTIIRLFCTRIRVFN